MISVRKPVRERCETEAQRNQRRTQKIENTEDAARNYTASNENRKLREDWRDRINSAISRSDATFPRLRDRNINVNFHGNMRSRGDTMKYDARHSPHDASASGGLTAVTWAVTCAAPRAVSPLPSPSACLPACLSACQPLFAGIRSNARFYIRYSDVHEFLPPASSFSFKSHRLFKILLLY